MDHEHLPPWDHRRKLLERAIQTAKRHFISIVYGVDTSFPMHLCCRLLPQADLTLNLIQQSNVAPNVSAYANVHGTHTFMRKPFAPMGCAVWSHNKAEKGSCGIYILWMDGTGRWCWSFTCAIKCMVEHPEQKE